jgi:hypothetical protein
VFYRLLGKTFAQAPLAAAGATLSLSVQAPVIPKMREVELLLVSALPIAEIKGEVTIERSEDPVQPWVTFRAPAPVTYAGPPLSYLRLSLPPTAQSGLFRITFSGQPAGAEPVMFAASET